MLAGTQLSKIGHLGLADLRLWVAVAAGTLALSTVGVVIWNVTRVLAPEWVSIHELIKDQEDQRQTDDLEFVEKNKYLYTGYDTIKALRENYDRLVRERDALVAQENWDKAKKKDTNVQYVDLLQSRLVSAVRADRVHRRFEHALRAMFKWGSLAALEIIIFSWAANPPTPTAVKNSNSSQSSLAAPGAKTQL